jgi:hypothetical protein
LGKQENPILENIWLDQNGWAELRTTFHRETIVEPIHGSTKASNPFPTHRKNALGFDQLSAAG